MHQNSLQKVLLAVTQRSSLMPLRLKRAKGPLFANDFECCFVKRCRLKSGGRETREGEGGGSRRARDRIEKKIIRPRSGVSPAKKSRKPPIDQSTRGPGLARLRAKRSGESASGDAPRRR